MQRAEEVRERVRNEQRLSERLQIATTRFADAQLERTWAIKSAHDLGLSIRQIAAATGLSASRIHQVLSTADAGTIPIWATQLQGTAALPQRLGAEAKLLRQCGQWLRQLESGGEVVVVNLRLDTDPETEYVRFDRLRVIRILERIAADLDQLAEGAPTQASCDLQLDRKRQLADPPKLKRRLSTREERNALRAELKLSPL